MFAVVGLIAVIVTGAVIVNENNSSQYETEVKTQYSENQ
jgi:hypothetical protein